AGCQRAAQPPHRRAGRADAAAPPDQHAHVRPRRGREPHSARDAAAAQRARRPPSPEGPQPMTETPYKLARRQTDQALVIFDDEGQELICLPERVRAEFGEAILAAVNEAHAAGARACRERIQGASMQAIEEYRQSLWGI